MVFDPDPECAAANSKLLFCFGSSCKDRCGRFSLRLRRRKRRDGIPTRRITMAAVTPGGVVVLFVGTAD